MHQIREQLRPAVSFLLLALILSLAAGCAGGMEEASEETVVVATRDEVAEETVDDEPSAAPSPTPAPTATAAAPQPTLSLEEQLQNIDRALADTMEGALAYDAPAAMDLNEVEEVRLLLDLTQTTGQLVDELEGEYGADEAGERQIEGAVINVTGQMQARLVSVDPEALEVESLSSEVQFVSATEPTEWKWLVRPRHGGRHGLYLIVSRLVQYGDDESWRLVQEYRQEIEVSVTPAARVRAFFDRYLFELIVALVVAIIAVFVQQYLERR